MDQTGAPDKRLPPVQWPFKQDSSSVHVTSNILLDTVHQSLCTMHSPVCISGNVLIHTLYTNLSVQPMHSLTCWYLGQHPHTHSVHRSPAECSHTSACHWNNKQSQPVSMCSGKGYYRKFRTTVYTVHPLNFA